MGQKLLHIFLLSITLLLLTKITIFAQSCGGILECNDRKLDCSACQTYLQSRKIELGQQADTLSAQIAVMDNQINLTEARIEGTRQQILNLNSDINTATRKIDNLETSLENLVKVLINRTVATYEIGQVQPFEILLSSGNATNFFSRLNYLKIVREHDKQLAILTQQAKNDYTNQKNIFEDKKKRVESLKTQLESYTIQLNQQKQAKETLLIQTQGDKAKYAALLDQVKALVSFATSTFGTTLVPHRDISDEFGKYYNQRDTNWGNNPIGYSSYTIAAAGCTLTSYAMVVSHFGGSLTPADVAANSGNFSGPLFLKPGPSANGHSAEAIDNPSLQQLRDALNSGAVVIAGLSQDGGPFPNHYSDHWVVLRSVDGDSFRINDPEYDGAINVSLKDHYSSWTIIESRIYR